LLQKITFGAHQTLVCFVDGAKQFAEGRRFLDRPHTVERRTEKIKVATGEQSDRHDAILSQKALRNLIYVRNNVLD